MKQLQNNYTTPEQSKRLLELGVPADSADCYIANLGDGFLGPYFLGMLYSEHVSMFKGIHTDDYTPCWSVGRLIEIYLKCNLKGKSMIIAKRHDPIGRCLYVFENEQLDFSKLEE